MFKQSVLIGILGSLLFSTQAWALFHVDTDSALNCNGRKVLEIGTGVSVPMQGFGHALPIGEASKLLLPPGWVPMIGKSVSKDTVSWKEGEAWTQAATGAQDKTACYVIDWNTRTFYASRDILALEKQVAANDPIYSPQAYARSALPPTVRAQTPPKPASHGAQSNATGRRLYPGSLRTQVAAWAESAGYNLDWEAPDYAVTAPATLTGDFRSAIQQALDTAGAHSHVKYRFSLDSRAGTLRVTQAGPIGPQARWNLHPGGLKTQIEAWASVAKYQVVWKSPDDFLISTDATLTGSFPDAVQQVVDGLHATGSAIAVQIYEGNHTVVVSETN